MPDDNPLSPLPADAGASIGAQGMAGGGFMIPEDIQKQFPELADLIAHSESMNDEERQYWVNILPIMTPEQIQNLKDILTNERTQLAAIDAKYDKEIQKVGQGEMLKQMEEERKQKREQRTGAEQAAKEQESSQAEDLLKKIEGV